MVSPENIIIEEKTLAEQFKLLKLAERELMLAGRELLKLLQRGSFVWRISSKWGYTDMNRESRIR